MTKYIFVTGGVLSSVGKGVVCASIGRILQVRGFKVTAIKIDPYLNFDAGTMNPFEHGEVFVCEDGGMMDLDLGTYERFLDINLSRGANITTGQIYGSVIDKERKGDFLGKCVQIIPHITDEIKNRMRKVTRLNSVDAVLVECGGTVGDIESLPFLEAFRQMRIEEGFLNTLFVHVPLVPILDVTNEQKSKPAQHSVQELRRIGLQPDVIVGRCRKMLKKDTVKKIALFGSVDEKAVFTSPDVKSIYKLPIVLDKQGLGNYICERLGLNHKDYAWSKWRQIVESMINAKHEVKIAICGKYATFADSYVSINEALKHAGGLCDTKIKIDWIETESFEEKPETIKSLSSYHGILVPGGFGERATEGKIAVIKYARENDLPFLGICFGFQLSAVEFARHSCMLEDANSTEINPKTPHPVVDLLPEQRNLNYKGATMRLGGMPVGIKPGTTAYKLYKSEQILERHRHRYEINPKYIPQMEKNGLVFSGFTIDKTRMEILELPSHFFFFATQFHPEFKSRPGRPDPAFYGFVKASLDKKSDVSQPIF
ncbi:CTP synthase [Candidatus Bathyarchaeota archaeon]|nr:CTP synthase [Candidatus Bathyarchaeota archaeon]